MPTTDRRKRLYAGKTEPYAKVWRDGKAKRVHQLLAEEKLGRKLEPGEVVHHKKGFEDALENVQVLPSQRHHMVVHHYERREARGVQHLFDLETVLGLLEDSGDKPLDGEG